MLRHAFKPSVLAAVLSSIRNFQADGPPLRVHGSAACRMVTYIKGFPALRTHTASHALLLLRAISPKHHHRVKNRLFPVRFEPELNFPDDNLPYDERIWLIESGTWLSGFFQSPKYFSCWEYRIRKWYHPPDAVSRKVKDAISRLPRSPTNMVAVHIRLGDYRLQGGRYADPQNGWVLSREYYEAALSVFPKETPIALFSDEVSDAISFLPRAPDWISHGNNALTDLFLMSAFPKIVIANSSFSWWSAWLNQQSNKIVIAPKYHAGRHLGCWFPKDISVDGWIYV